MSRSLRFITALALLDFLLSASVLASDDRLKPRRLACPIPAG